MPSPPETDSDSHTNSRCGSDTDALRSTTTPPIPHQQCLTYTPPPPPKGGFDVAMAEMGGLLLNPNPNLGGL